VYKQHDEWSMTFNIRDEIPEDYRAVHQVNEQAFGRPEEADLVDALRKSHQPHISLVAEVEGRIVGHIFFSTVQIESEASATAALGLAPMAVLPKFQNQGIGSALVRRGLEECRSIGHEVVVVLGHPEYYPRFGFVPAKQKGLSCEYSVPDEVFMALELREGALSGRKGLVKYGPEFGSV
jgi:putative acetyltransferase